MTTDSIKMLTCHILRVALHLFWRFVKCKKISQVSLQLELEEEQMLRIPAWQTWERMFERQYTTVREDEMKDSQVHFGKCRIQLFHSAAHTRD